MATNTNVDPRQEMKRQNLLKVGALVIVGGVAAFAFGGRFLRRDMSTVSKEATRIYHAAHDETEYARTARKAEEAARALRKAAASAASTHSAAGAKKVPPAPLATGKATLAASHAADELSRRLAEGTKPTTPLGGEAEGLPGTSPAKAAKAGAGKQEAALLFRGEDEEEEDDVLVPRKGAKEEAGAGAGASGGKKEGWKEWR